MDFHQCSYTCIVIKVENKKVFQDVAMETKCIHRASKVRVIPIMIGALETISTKAIFWHVKLKRSNFIAIILLAAIL